MPWGDNNVWSVPLAPGSPVAAAADVIANGCTLREASIQPCRDKPGYLRIKVLLFAPAPQLVARFPWEEANHRFFRHFFNAPGGLRDAYYHSSATGTALTQYFCTRFLAGPPGMTLNAQLNTLLGSQHLNGVANPAAWLAESIMQGKIWVSWANVIREFTTGPQPPDPRFQLNVGNWVTAPRWRHNRIRKRIDYLNDKNANGDGKAPDSITPGDDRLEILMQHGVLQWPTHHGMSLMGAWLDPHRPNSPRFIPPHKLNRSIQIKNLGWT